MSKIFRPNNKESLLLSKIESSKERDRRLSINMVREHGDALGNAIAMKLVENKIVETRSKNSLEEQITNKLNELGKADDFDIDYKIAPYRNLISNPNLVSLFITAFVLENLINHKDVVDIYGSDDEVYHCINKQIMKFLPE
ncbi:MAG: hypothetical protein WC799_23135 [Desulfobacteraceae bacterium]|jgi:hypothetical protein